MSDHVQAFYQQFGQTWCTAANNHNSLEAKVLKNSPEPKNIQYKSYKTLKNLRIREAGTTKLNK